MLKKIVCLMYTMKWICYRQKEMCSVKVVLRFFIYMFIYNSSAMERAYLLLLDWEDSFPKCLGLFLFLFV